MYSANRDSKLKEKEIEACNGFPDLVIYSPTDVTNPGVTGPMLYAKLVVRLEHLQNMFFIERLSNRIDGNKSIEMVEISVEMVTLTLIFWTHKDRLSDCRADFDWLVMFYAAPAAGILCMELLKPSMIPSEGTPERSRSSMVQKLSLLIGFLDWFGPGAPNENLCCRVKAVIEQVLDYSLNSQEGTTESQDPQQDINWDFSADINDFFNFELLDSFDWLRPDGEIN